MKLNIEIHLVFADNSVRIFEDPIECIAFLTAHLCYVSETDTIVEKQDVLLRVLSSGLSAEDETYINQAVAFNRKYIIGEKPDDKTIN
tara:strand:- start:755 stop:1018 length:264 start_codon:yes stop_codon:yes gene_type:complete